jgi:hypothetical protein
VGVSRDIGQDSFGTGERRFGIDAPFCVAGRGEVAAEGAAVAKRLQGAVEGQLFGVEGFLQSGKKQSAEEMCKHADRQKEVGPAGDPAAAIWRQTATGDDAMQVRMMQQGLAPTV